MPALRTGWLGAHGLGTLRRANVKLKLSKNLLEGSGMVPIYAVVRVAEALEPELQLEPGRTPQRAVGPVSTVVDATLQRLRES